MTETAFYKQISLFLDAIPGCYWEKIQAGSIRGRSDIFLCIRGRFVALELKRDQRQSQTKGRAKLQSVLQERIREAGGIALFVSPETWDEVYEYLLDLSRRKARV